MKWLNFTIGSILLVAAAVFTAVKFGSHEIQQLQIKVDQLEQERQRLVDFAHRLSAERRVAQVDVLRQRMDQHGHTVSTLVWQEIGTDGTLGKPVAVEVVGELVYFEALVIKFAHNYVREGDPERGASLAMFRRIFGDQQVPESAPELDRTTRPPIGTSTESPSFQDELWARFWEMIDDPQLAARYGVRVAQCEAPAVPLRGGQIWEVALDAAGGLNLRMLGVRGEKAIESGQKVGLIGP